MIGFTILCRKIWRRLRKTSMIVYTILAALLGITVGLAFSAAEVPSMVVYWFGMPGNLFIRALTLVVVPLVFCSVVLGVVGVSDVGGSVGKLALWTCSLYAITTTVGVLEGLAFVQSFRFAWKTTGVSDSASIYCDPSSVTWDQTARVSIINTLYMDSNSNFNSTTANYVSMKLNGDTTMTNFTNLSYNAPQTISFLFSNLIPVGPVSDLGVYFLNGTLNFMAPSGSLAISSGDDISTDGATSAGQSVSDSISNLLLMLVPRNALGTFVGNADSSANLLGMIMVAIGFGVSLTILKSRNKITGDHLEQTLRQCLDVVMYFTDKLMMLTPFAVFSLITNAFGSQTLDELGDSMQSLGILFATVIMAFLFHALVFLGGMLFLFTRQNPLKHYIAVSPALNVAFACASSASTLPTTMECADKLGLDSSVSKFVLSLGATINMDGNAIFQPAIMMWLANSAGISVSIADQVIICVVSALASMGSSPAPGLTPAVILVWQACFPGNPVPDAIAYVLALDWLLDRCITTLNVSGDTVAARIVDFRHKKMKDELANAPGSSSLDAEIQMGEQESCVKRKENGEKDNCDVYVDTGNHSMTPLGDLGKK